MPADVTRGAIKFPVLYNRTTTLERVTAELVQRYNKSIEYDKEKKEKVVADRLLYMVLNGENFSIEKPLEGNENISGISKDRRILFCLQLPALKDEEAFVAEFVYKD